MTYEADHYGPVPDLPPAEPKKPALIRNIGARLREAIVGLGDDFAQSERDLRRDNQDRPRP